MMKKMLRSSRYDEADPSTYHHQISDTESEDTVAPTPDDHEQEAEADTVGTITRVPYHCAAYYSGTSMWELDLLRQVVGSCPTARDDNTLHRGPSQGLVQQIDLRVIIRVKHALGKKRVTLEDQVRELVKGDREENKKLKMIGTYTRFRHYHERPYVVPTTPVTPVDRTDPGDPSPRPTRRPRHDDPYVMVRDAATKIIMPPRAMTQAAIEKLVSDRVAEALAQDRATRGNTNGAGRPGGNTGGNAGGQGRAPPTRECTYSSFMKCNPTSFHGNEGAVELCCWFEKMKSVFSISECAKRNKVKFVAATLQGRALTWWNSQVATLGLEVANAKSWNDMKIMMREEFCPPEEIQRMEVELWNLRVKDSNISAYTQRFNELVLLCPEMVSSEKKKVEAYLRGLPENIKGETTSSRPVVLNEAV
ncbi:putative reverse transcriptase domain-containing protein [Tanacetum coccineum]|uniref:Reverse transcriptase domain-containing protein n=1 Tax=Tanacetum coccineum TaxID=301880 RepID=A0ABQ5D5D5_9ASTR